MGIFHYCCVSWSQRVVPLSSTSILWNSNLPRSRTGVFLSDMPASYVSWSQRVVEWCDFSPLSSGHANCINSPSQKGSQSQNCQDDVFFQSTANGSQWSMEKRWIFSRGWWRSFPSVWKMCLLIKFGDFFNLAMFSSAKLKMLGQVGPRFWWIRTSTRQYTNLILFV